MPDFAQATKKNKSGLAREGWARKFEITYL